MIYDSFAEKDFEKDQTKNFSPFFVSKTFGPPERILEKQPIPLQRVPLEIHFKWLF